MSFDWRASSCEVIAPTKIFQHYDVQFNKKLFDPYFLGFTN
jgi:hypothetical protein